MHGELKRKIEQIWNNQRPTDSGCSEKSLSDMITIEDVIKKLDGGLLRTAVKLNDAWQVNDFVKKAILLYMKYTKSEILPAECTNYFDKIPPKTRNWTENEFLSSGFRLVPGSMVRYGAFIAKSVVVMPSFVNIGAYIDEGTMIDTNALVGSCAQIGKNCHISDGVSIGGVLEPIQANPVIVEDNCFIGVRSSITEGIIVGEGSVISAGTCLTASTKIINRDTGDVSHGTIPPYSVVVPGSYQSRRGLSLHCAVIVKQVDEKTRKKTSVNELLRD